jgi:hypothetical protein
MFFNRGIRLALAQEAIPMTRLELAQKRVRDGRDRVANIQRLVEHLQQAGDTRGEAQARLLLSTLSTRLRIHEDDWERLLQQEDRRLSFFSNWHK